MKARFITLEGIEGSGKTTSIKSINNFLEQKKICYINTREPGASSIGSELREILLNPNTNISSDVELLLMLADRKDHVEKIILPNLLNDICVISDRFMDSSIAYQGGGRQLDLNMINSLSAYLEFPNPDLTLLFDLPVKISLERTKKRGELDRFEKEEIEFHNRIRASYLKLANDNSDRIKVIDSSQSPDKVQAKVIEIISKLF
ncbi:uncharacterized protein METZ01_LOCUS475822 [marine metagenome]|uniref:dTMP kinase n=1 Tax=marine metagenome TaxID=408172 RepID=A0A383BUB0_9ZZZZ